jgi:hypothetical protein
MAKYLNEYGSPEDIVAVTNGDMVLKFYTKTKVVGGMMGEDLTPVKNARWVIMRHYVICDKDKKVQKYLREETSRQNFRWITINYPDIPFENRESPGEHFFRTDTRAPEVVIGERMN